MIRRVHSLIICGAFCALSFNGQAQYVSHNKEKVNDFNTPMHLMKPEYKTPYGVATPEEVKGVIDRVLTFLEPATPFKVINKETQAEVTDLRKIDKNSVLEKGTFRLASYEWGVTYAGMLLAAQTTGDARYSKYVSDRFNFLASVAPYFEKLRKEGIVEPQIRQVIHPEALDDAGAMCSAMIKAQNDGLKCNTRAMIDNYIDFVMNKEYRLADGTFARKRPMYNSVWLDDMFMAIPAIANMGKLTGDKKYYDEAVKQVLQFADRMFIKEKGLYRHGWVEGMSEHPAFHWGRANGWAILTKVEVLDALPENYPGRDKILELLRAHIRGLAACQSGEGFWHQLLDRNDSYLETSATAIYTYCIAHAINKGWIDPLAYGPVAMLGWHAVESKVNQAGEVEGTCVGTGMGFDPAYYYYRPVHKYAAHGYGPVILAGGEMIRLLKTTYPKMNDSAVQFYHKQQKTDKPIFAEE
ncbi:glycoside hydrolase family 105 protein [Parabacteroides sp. FAFU027]|uniref:glycoside hydrolase family 88/105 protein n=1 Tax=Parabacteroides sp. FAFU027 TaxID=2922715 RepID=UPI001FAF17C3|nr:glycoside hydrolase family 88 protein [Parabacteroides sp. FAFU027]